MLMGSRLLFIDVADLIHLLVKQLRGEKITNREKRKIKRTINDIVALVPITILMIIPVSIYFQNMYSHMLKLRARWVRTIFKYKLFKAHFDPLQV